MTDRSDVRRPGTACRPMMLAAALAATFAVAACGGGTDPGPVQGQDAVAPTAGAPPATTTDAGTVASGSDGSGQTASVPVAEADSLAFMREEERLAHDVYAVAASTWTQPIFGNIRDSETTHTLAVKSLLDARGLPDPLEGLPEGRFRTPALQALYDALSVASRASYERALQVGAEIEELDIRDIGLQKAVVSDAAIVAVYDQLLRGSRNHLRAFDGALARAGATYEPKYITRAEYDAIVGSETETGR